MSKPPSVVCLPQERDFLGSKPSRGPSGPGGEVGLEAKRSSTSYCGCVCDTDAVSSTLLSDKNTGPSG